MVRAVANTMFDGDFSKALDFILYTFRANTIYSKAMEFLKLKADYDAGIRSIAVLDGVRQLQALLKAIEESGIT